MVWGVDAWFKWQPAFVDHLVAYIVGAVPQTGTHATRV